MLADFLNFSNLNDKSVWVWNDNYFTYFKNVSNYDISLEGDYYFSNFYYRFYYLFNLGKNSMLINTNNYSNTAMQGKVNFFDVNNNIYCLNSFYLQNFYKILNKKSSQTKKFLKKKIKKNYSLSFVYKLHPLKKQKLFLKNVFLYFNKRIKAVKIYDFFKIKNYKITIKVLYLMNYDETYIFNNYSKGSIFFF